MRAPEWLKPGMSVFLRWVDITEDSEVTPDKKITPLYCRSIGWVDCWDDDFITLMKEDRGTQVDKQIFPWGVVLEIAKVETVPKYQS